MTNEFSTGSGRAKNGSHGQSTRPGSCEAVSETRLHMAGQVNRWKGGDINVLEIVCALFHQDSVSRVVAITTALNATLSP